MTLPKISIVVTNLNLAEYLEETLLSILGQDYRAIEDKASGNFASTACIKDQAMHTRPGVPSAIDGVLVHDKQ